MLGIIILYIPGPRKRFSYYWPLDAIGNGIRGTINGAPICIFYFVECYNYKKRFYKINT